MPNSAVYEYWVVERNWKNYSRWQRKRFHRENDSRERRGLPRLNKPL